MQFVSEEESSILIKDSGIEIFDAIKGIPFEEKSWIPDDCGVYILTRTDGERYVGSSFNIFKRTRYHHIGNIEIIDIYLTNKIDYIILEKWFIDQIKPSLNEKFYTNKIHNKKSVPIDNEVYQNLIQVQSIISSKKRYTFTLGDIVSTLLSKDPEVIANEVIELAESTSTNKKQV